ncbi:MAG: amidohydrolase family protein [Vicinamibacteria bacterium]
MRITVVACAALLSLSLLAPEPAAGQVISIKAGRLVDPENGTSSPNQVILVEGGKITAVGTDVEIPESAQVIDLSSATVMPGMFDCHAHMAAFLLKPNPAYFTGWTKTTPYRVLRGAAHAREMLEAGFTTIRDLGVGGAHGDTALRLAIEEGYIPGPTMVNAGRFIGPFGAGSIANPERPGLNEPDHMDADTRGEIRKAIRENIHYGAKVIKVTTDSKPYMYSVEDLRFIVNEAGRAGLKVAAHAVTNEGALRAATAGVASIEHGTEMGPEAQEMAKRNGVYLVATPFTPFLIRQMGIRLSGMREDENWQDFDAVHVKYVSALKRNYGAGLRLAFGSDVGVLAEGETRGTLSISTVDGWISAGVPPQVIVQALTTNAARLVGVDDQRGAIRPGFAADIVAMLDDPLVDASAVKRVFFVMKEGRVYRHDAESGRAGTRESSVPPSSNFP